MLPDVLIGIHFHYHTKFVEKVNHYSEKSAFLTKFSDCNTIFSFTIYTQSEGLDMLVFP